MEAGLAWGIDNNLTRKLSNADPVQITMLKGLAAGIVNLILALTLGAAVPPLGAIAGAALVGVLGYGVSLVLFVLACNVSASPPSPDGSPSHPLPLLAIIMLLVSKKSIMGAYSASRSLVILG